MFHKVYRYFNYLGGHGALTRLYGFGADNLVSMDIILANYTIVTASETQNQDLFRALRGSILELVSA